MKTNLEKDLEETTDFFNTNFKSKDGFCRELEFTTMSNSYVRVLEEAIKKQNFPTYDVYTKIKKQVNSDSDDRTNNFKYRLIISFDRNY